VAELNMERRFAVMGAAFRLEQLETERAVILQEFPEVAAMLRKPRLTRAKLNGVESAARDLWAGREAAKLPRKAKAKRKAKGRDISDETRERMAKAARARWKLARAHGVGGGKLPAAKDLAKAAKKTPATKKRKMTPEGRKKIAAARRLRANEERKRKGLPALPSS
jgi:hypothetical protein